MTLNFNSVHVIPFTIYAVDKHSDVLTYKIYLWHLVILPVVLVLKEE
jgi:hypothetical protein